MSVKTRTLRREAPVCGQPVRPETHTHILLEGGTLPYPIPPPPPSKSLSAISIRAGTEVTVPFFHPLFSTEVRTGWVEQDGEVVSEN